MTRSAVPRRPLRICGIDRDCRRVREVWAASAKPNRAEITNILVADLLDDRLHLIALARAAAEENQLPLNELIGLAGKRGNVFGLRNAGFAVTADAELGRFLARGDVSGVGRDARER